MGKCRGLGLGPGIVLVCTEEFRKALTAGTDISNDDHDERREKMQGNNSEHEEKIHNDQYWEWSREQGAGSTVINRTRGGSGR